MHEFINVICVNISLYKNGIVRYQKNHKIEMWPSGCYASLYRNQLFVAPAIRLCCSIHADPSLFSQNNPL